MKKRIVFIILIFMITCISVLSREAILKVGNTIYNEDDLKTRLEYEYISYEKLILDLARNEVMNNQEKNKALIYKDFFGIDIKKDEIYLQATDMPEERNQASSRELIFDSWLDQKAIRVPVYFLNFKKFCDIVSGFKSYEIKREAGLEEDITTIPYTFAELQLKENKVLAQKNGKPYLSTPEFDEYVKENYYNIRVFARRNKSLNEARNFLIKRITAEKLKAGEFNIKDMELDEVDVEKYVSIYIYENMFKEDLNFTGETYATPSDMSEALYIKYYFNQKDKLDKIRKAMQGEMDFEKESYNLKFYICKVKLQLMKSPLLQDISETMVYNWIDATKFSGTMVDAQQTIIEEVYTNIINEYEKKSTLIINSLLQKSNNN